LAGYRIAVVDYGQPGRRCWQPIRGVECAGEYVFVVSFGDVDVCDDGGVAGGVAVVYGFSGWCGCWAYVVVVDDGVLVYVGLVGFVYFVVVEYVLAGVGGAVVDYG